MKLTSLHIIKISWEILFSTNLFRNSPDDRDQGENIIVLLVSFKEHQNQCIFFYIRLDAWMAIAGAVLALVW